MANPLRYTLVSDGSSDRALIPIIDWCLLSIPEVAERGIQSAWADLRGRQKQPGLRGRIQVAVQDFPCDLLFVHRDAESSERTVRIQRYDEIRKALEPLSLPHVGVVPVRMTEAWLLLDAEAIRKAADNPHCQVPLPLPPLRQLESLSDPKQLLFALLDRASEKTGRRLEQFRRDRNWRRVRVAGLIGDFSPLRKLSAFAQFEQDTQEKAQELVNR